jgi:hypothetical protein
MRLFSGEISSPNGATEVILPVAQKDVWIIMYALFVLMFGVMLGIQIIFEQHRCLKVPDLYTKTDMGSVDMAHLYGLKQNKDKVTHK